MTLTGPVRLSQDTPSVQQADEHWFVRGSDGAPLFRCSLWYTSVPAHQTHKLGFIGHYSGRDVEHGSHEAAALLLETACRRLADHGCTLAVGPIDGSTFRHYRFLTERKVGGVERPTFFLEPDNPDIWPQQFVEAGFEPMARYLSAYGVLPDRDPRLKELSERVGDAGVTVRPVDLDAFSTELERIYEIVIDCFRNNFLYSPVTREEFLHTYGQIRPYVRPEHVYTAEQGSVPVGFLFALPDVAQRLRGQRIDTLILKTAGVRPQVAGHGIASLLVAKVQTEARAKGFRNLIHALMHEGNVSRRISGHYATPMRRYTLFQRILTA